ncbi:hypothetical protein HDF24_01915 [Mucilaginibacter sp. X4EP1]|uniref:hypothetical protein n=1 Tax=Mucilaginibacter sp. X4EP1 TaxID=2723092 RepID=UPI002169924D|nr:hypothetical protein [Mucilaginibacter sp. X4EP1]MCS3811770.1 hypothetical protein [Mucilaginibacter sp. X4EP1]
MFLNLIDFLHKTIGIGKDTAATILVTLFTFSLGIFITVILKGIVEFLDRRNHRKLLKLNLVILMKETFRQASAYNKFSEQLTIEAISIPTFRKVSISSAGILYQLGYKNLYNAIFNGIENIHFRRKNLKRIAFNNIWSTLEHLALFHQKSFEEFEKFTENEKNANELRNQCLLEANRIVGTIRYTFHKERIDANIAAYCTELENILLNHQRQSDITNPKIVNDYFVRPLFELNEKDPDLLKEYFKILNPVLLNSILSECLIRYENQKNLIETARTYYKHLDEMFIVNFLKAKSACKTLFRIRQRKSFRMLKFFRRRKNLI